MMFLKKWILVIILKRSILSSDGDWVAKPLSTIRKPVPEEYMYESKKYGIRFSVDLVSEVGTLTFYQPFNFVVKGSAANWFYKFLYRICGSESKSKLDFFVNVVSDKMNHIITIKNNDYITIYKKLRGYKSRRYVVLDERTAK